MKNRPSGPFCEGRIPRVERGCGLRAFEACGTQGWVGADDQLGQKARHRAAPPDAGTGVAGRFGNEGARGRVRTDDMVLIGTIGLETVHSRQTSGLARVLVQSRGRR
ncbi:conserved hypothetical protein [Methylorubrum extorquens AM1]|uniref:Uncharacterized protein n=1 Tax=Methylorubrum extorquens (strain ATCC 14718 / DSM 1338 / JCM 2805 / NCIMB 9133 / AM1) TaxID=272630 RepID=C5AZN4_METEA|nr:conserved hypothetical protein [Methylorubrum extorquens AM1]